MLLKFEQVHCEAKSLNVVQPHKVSKRRVTIWALLQLRVEPLLCRRRLPQGRGVRFCRDAGAALYSY